MGESAGGAVVLTFSLGSVNLINEQYLRIGEVTLKTEGNSIDSKRTR